MSAEMKYEAQIKRFLSAHYPGRVFNVNEVWYWLKEHQSTIKPETQMIPSPSTIRRYLLRMADRYYEMWKVRAEASCQKK